MFLLDDRRLYGVIDFRAVNRCEWFWRKIAVSGCANRDVGAADARSCLAIRRAARLSGPIGRSAERKGRIPVPG